ncbi:MAG: DUF2764 family protein [Paludibacter sp.]|nr:DUF2764 family protein [Paludibacter sp.]
MNYYCLIAGLPDIHTEDTKTAFSIPELKNELLEQLSASDARLLKLIFAAYDNANFLAFIANKEAGLNPLGNLSSTDWLELMLLMNESENPQDLRLMPYIQKFHSTYSDEKFLAEGISPEDYLATLYFEEAFKCENKFLQKWFDFNLNLNNILSAVACRNHGFDPHTLVIGTNEVATTLRQSNARDFGLTGLFEQLDLVLRIAEENDLLEREKKIDALKWAWLEENTFFNYFTVERVLAFVLKIQMIDRWKMLSIEKGEQIFKELLGSMKEGASFDSSNA